MEEKKGKGPICLSSCTCWSRLPNSLKTRGVRRKLSFKWLEQHRVALTEVEEEILTETTLPAALRSKSLQQGNWKPHCNGPMENNPFLLHACTHKGIHTRATNSTSHLELTRGATATEWIPYVASTSLLSYMCKDCT